MPPAAPRKSVSLREEWCPTFVFLPRPCLTLLTGREPKKNLLDSISRFSPLASAPYRYALDRSNSKKKWCSNKAHNYYNHSTTVSSEAYSGVCHPSPPECFLSILSLAFLLPFFYCCVPLSASSLDFALPPFCYYCHMNSIVALKTPFFLANREERNMPLTRCVRVCWQSGEMSPCCLRGGMRGAPSGARPVGALFSRARALLPRNPHSQHSNPSLRPSSPLPPAFKDPVPQNEV